LGHAQIEVDGLAREKAEGRSDLLVFHNDKALAVFELKRPGLPLTDQDRDQALSYARVLHPRPPLVVLSNGADTKIFATHTGDIWQPETPNEEQLAYNLEGAIWRMRTINCVEQRLDTLAKTLDEASRSGILPPVGYISGTPGHMWRSGAWESVVASQTAVHFPRQQLADLGALYKVVQRIEEYSAPDAIAWSDLYAMVGPGRRLDPASETGLRTALMRARNSGRTMALLSMFVANQARVLNLPFTKSDLEQITVARTQPLTRPPTWARNLVAPINATGQMPSMSATSPTSICEPLGPVPPSYGEAPAKGIQDLVTASAKSLPDFGAIPP
jgi:hypothetical protein